MCILEDILSYKEINKQMRYVFVLAPIVLALLMLYYILVALQCFNIVRFTKKDIEFTKGMIPFYYFIFG